MKVEICVKPRLGQYQLWIKANETDWIGYLRSMSATELTTLIHHHASRMGIGTPPDVLVIDDDRKPVPIPLELKDALDRFLPR